MPTVITFTIGPSGKQFTSMTACRVANAKDLPVADEQHIYEFYTFSGGLDDNDAFVGYTDDATRNIILRAAPSDQWDGIDPETGFYFKAILGSHVIRPISGIQNMRVEGLSFVDCVQPAISRTNNGNYQVMNDCGFLNIPDRNIPTGFLGTVDNVLMINPGSDGGVVSIAVNKLTVINSGFRGIVTLAGSSVTNSFFFGSSNVDFSDQGGTHSNNATEDTTAAGTSPQINRTSADFANFASDDFRTASGSTLATAGTVDFIGYALEVNGGISVTEQTVNTNYTSLDPIIVLTGSLLITESLVNTNYAALNPVIILTGVISITEQLSNTNYTSLDPIIDLTGLVDITENLVNTNYTALNPTITLTAGVIAITESTVNTQYNAINPSILLTPEPLGIVSTVCFDGVLINIEHNGTQNELSFNGQSINIAFNGNFNEIEFNGTIQTSCNPGSIKTNC